MPETIAPGQYKAEVKRTLNASCERIYKAWTTPEQLQKWFAPNPRIKCHVCEADVRVGGKYRIELLHDDGDKFIAFGVYKELNPPNKLSFTWAWEESSIEKGETLISVLLENLGGKTQMTLNHSKLSSEVSATEHTKGWTGCMDSLVEYVDNNSN